MSIVHKGIKIASNAVTGDTLPIGSQVPFGSLTIPDNWLLCDGREVSRLDYSELFAVIGTSYGVGNGSTTFNIPNKKGRTSAGYDGSQTEFDTIGKTGGAKTHTLTEAEMPIHNHSMKFANNGREVVTTNYGSISPRNDVPWEDGNIIKNTGGGQAHNNLQPYQTDVWIIKVKQSAGVVATVVDTLTSTSTINALSANQGKELNDRLNNLLDCFYPVGTIYETTSTDLDTMAKMNAHFGGTWEVYGAGRVLVAKSEDTAFDTIGEIGGDINTYINLN